MSGWGLTSRDRLSKHLYHDHYSSGSGGTDATTSLHSIWIDTVNLKSLQLQCTGSHFGLLPVTGSVGQLDTA